MDRFVYRDILKEKMVPHADNNMLFYGHFNKTTSRNTRLNSLNNVLKRIKLK